MADEKKYNTKQMEMGIKVEAEHKSAYDKIKQYYKEHNEFPPEDVVYGWISENHLDEDDIYYTHLKEMEDKYKKSSPTTQASSTNIIRKYRINEEEFDNFADAEEYHNSLSEEEQNNIEVEEVEFLWDDKIGMWEESNVRIIKQKGSVMAKDEWVEIDERTWKARGEKLLEVIYYNTTGNKIKWELYIDDDLAERELIGVEELKEKGFTEKAIEEIQDKIAKINK